MIVKQWAKRKQTHPVGLHREVQKSTKKGGEC